MVKKIGKIAEAVSTNQSGAIRFLIEEGLNSGQTIMVLRQGIGRGVTGRVARAYAAKIKSDAAQAAADRAPDDPKAHAKASRAKRGGHRPRARRDRSAVRPVQPVALSKKLAAGIAQIKSR